MSKYKTSLEEALKRFTKVTEGLKKEKKKE